MDNKVMKVGVIGAGAISDIYLKNMTQRFDNLEVVCVAANHLEHAQTKAQSYGLQACTVDELLENADVDIVVVLTPVGSHYELILRALMAGKHVYTEKTITDDPAKAGELLSLAAEKGLYIGAAPDTFLGAACQNARKAIEEGKIGEIHSFAISANRNNDILLSLFSFLRQPGAGILYDYAVYYVTALVSLLGRAKRVGGIVSTPYPKHVNILPSSPEFGQEMDTPNESQVNAVIQLENGITGTLHIDADSNMRDEAFFAIYGTKGILYLTDANSFGGEVKLLEGADPRVPAQAKVVDYALPYSDNSRGLGVSEMAAAIASGRPCLASGEMAAHVLNILTGILQGGSEGRFIDII